MICHGSCSLAVDYLSECMLGARLVVQCAIRRDRESRWCTYLHMSIALRPRPTSHTKPVMLVYQLCSSTLWNSGPELRTIHHAAKIGAHLFTAM